MIHIMDNQLINKPIYKMSKSAMKSPHNPSLIADFDILALVNTQIMFGIETMDK